MGVPIAEAPTLVLGEGQVLGSHGSQLVFNLLPTAGQVLLMPLWQAQHTGSPVLSLSQPWPLKLGFSSPYEGVRVCTHCVGRAACLQMHAG